MVSKKMNTKDAIKTLTTDHYAALEVIQKILSDNHDALLGMSAFIKERGLQDQYDRWVEALKNRRVH